MLGDYLRMREHLLEHWDVADEWKHEVLASDGTPCFAHQAGVYRTFDYELAVDAYVRLHLLGKEHCLGWLNKQIAERDRSFVSPVQRILFKFRNWRNPRKVAFDRVRLAEDKVLQTV